jgi:hypothetical protein
MDTEKFVQNRHRLADNVKRPVAPRHISAKDILSQIEAGEDVTAVMDNAVKTPKQVTKQVEAVEETVEEEVVEVEAVEETVEEEVVEVEAVEEVEAKATPKKKAKGWK